MTKLRVAALGLVAVAVPALTLLEPAPSATAQAAKAKVVSACGIKALPLSVGNTWTFVAAAPPQEPSPQQKLLLPVQPKQVVLAVTKIESDPKTKLTTVSMTETIDGRVVDSSITCSADGATFAISPQSMLYTGEPGGWFGLEFPTWTPSGPTWQTTKGNFTPEWREDVKATWKRLDADKATGTLELEHSYQVGEPESVGTNAGTFNAYKLIVEVTGRVGIDKPVHADKPMELPENWINALWLADGVGPVQVLNSYAHMYSLQDFKLAS
jgi:hypothetical protein